MKLVIGLGNPGQKYDQTRHNVGYEVMVRLAQRYAASSRPKEKFRGEVTEASIAGESVTLVRPLTFMNRSGQCVQPLRDFFKLPNEDMLIVCDDFNLPVGQLRLKAQGSAGGQNGLADIIQRCGQDVPRLRIGIGSPPPQWDPADYVLGKFGREDAAEMKIALDRAANAAADWVERGVEYCMNQYNVKATSGE